MWVYFLVALLILLVGGSIYFKSETPKPCPCSKNNGAST